MKIQNGRIVLPVALFVFALFLPVIVHAQPAISFWEEIHDAGDVTQGDPVEYVFTFENKGTEELVIQKVTSS